MTAHPHAANMLAYAQDAAETDKPWERWQFRHFGGKVGDWEDNLDNPVWDPGTEYRRKPNPLEMWANLYPNGSIGMYMTKMAAIDCSTPDCKRIAVHMREVTE